MEQTLETPEEKFNALTQVFLDQPDVTQGGKGFGATALKVNQKIFAMLADNKLTVKLPKQQVDALVAAGAGERFDPRRDGRVMKEWLVVKTASLEEWLKLAAEAKAFVGAQS